MSQKPADGLKVHSPNENQGRKHRERDRSEATGEGAESPLFLVSMLVVVAETPELDVALRIRLLRVGSGPEEIREVSQDGVGLPMRVRDGDRLGVIVGAVNVRCKHLQLF